MQQMWRPSRAYTFTTASFLRQKTSAIHPSVLHLSIRGFASAKRLDAAEFELLLPAVEAFHSRFGHFLVPYSFPIPPTDTQWPEQVRGVNIGRRLHAFMTSARHRKQNPQLLDQLSHMGFPIHADWKRLLWEKRILAALQTYYRIHSHSIVPVGFVVPSGSDQWPVETWHLDLGKRVAKLREHRERLSGDELTDLRRVAFSFDVDATQWDDKIRPALRTFHEVFGHGFVKRDFVVPHQTPWRKETWGLRLGLVVHNIRCHGAYDQQVQRDRDELKRDGWVHLVGSPEDEWKQVVLPAIRAFHKVHGHANVPATFVVPQREPWPRATHGFSLGQLIHTPHALEIFSDQLMRDDLVLHELGAWWFGSVDEKWDQQILPALQVYAQVHGANATMPVRFIVPKSTPWPQAAWGLRLGEIVGRMRTRDHFKTQRLRCHDALQALQITMPVV